MSDHPTSEAGLVTSTDGRSPAQGPADPVVVAVVPAKDRADSVGATVRSLRSLDGVDRVLVVDDGSTDDTTGEARRAGAEVLRLPHNVGKGGAVSAAVDATPSADVYLLIDADVGDYAVEAAALLTPVLEGSADLVIGVLPSPGTRGGFGNVRRFSRWGIRRASGLDTRAPLSGQRAVRAEHLRGLRASGRFGLEVAMSIDAARNGARVVEIDVPMEHRHTGRSVSGFRHRGTQGLDIATALWPRLVPATVRRVGLLAVVGAILLGSFVTAGAARPDGRPLGAAAEQVVIFGIPGVALGDISTEHMPNLSRLADQGALGLSTPRTGGGVTPVAVYATIGAGDRVRAGAAGGLALGPDAPIEGDPAATVIARRSGTTGEGAVLVPSIAAVVRDAGEQVNSRPGALGEAVGRAGLQTAVVANSTTVTESGEPDLSAPAALAVVDRDGGVDHGDVGADLIHASATSPFGVEVDPEQFAAAVTRAVAAADLTVVDPGEMDRFHAYERFLSAGQRPESRSAALRRTDDVLGRVAAGLPDDTLLVISGITPAAGGKLVPVVLHGAGVDGARITSASTRRADLVAATDLAPTALRALGVPVPDAMIGQPVRFMSGTPDRTDLQGQEDLIVDRDAVYGGLHRTFVLVAIAVYAVAAVVVLGPRRSSRTVGALRVAALTTMAWPVAGFVARIVPATYGWGWASHLFVWALAAVIAVIADRTARRPMDALLTVSAVTVLVLVLDVMTGAHLQVSSYLGYTPSVAARFVGLGNAAFGILAGATILTCALLVARSDRRTDAWWVAAAVAVVAVVADGAPWLGADVGGILSLVPALGVLLLLLAGRRLTWRVAALFLAAAVALLAISVGFEAARAAEHRTHIGRFFLGDGADGTFGTTLARKWDVNQRLLTNSRWSWLIPALGAFVVAVLAFGGRWSTLLRRRSAERAAVVALAVAGFLGWATNDSGPLVAALVLVYLAPLVLHLALRGPEPEPEHLLPSMVDVVPGRTSAEGSA